MNNISYNAVLLCVPVVGPVAGLYNKLRTEVAFDRLRGNSLLISNGRLPLIISQTSQRARTYSACAVVGNVLTVALVARLVALGILTSSGFTIGAMACCTTLALIHGLDYLKYNYASKLADSRRART